MGREQYRPGVWLQSAICSGGSCWCVTWKTDGQAAVADATGKAKPVWGAGVDKDGVARCADDPMARAVMSCKYTRHGKDEDVLFLNRTIADCRRGIADVNLTNAPGATMNQPDQQTAIGVRDRMLLLFLYNSGARADEAAKLTLGALQLEASPLSVSLARGTSFECALSGRRRRRCCREQSVGGGK
jgi:hypothetical protein